MSGEQELDGSKGLVSLGQTPFVDPGQEGEWRLIRKKDE